MQIMSRQAARDLKLKRYYTGQPCVHGHDAERHTVSGQCVECKLKARAIGPTGKPAGRPRLTPEGYRKPLAESTLQKQAMVADLPDDLKARLVSRKEAKASGLKRYFTGLPCINGHVSERYVGKVVCVECRKLETQRYAKSEAKKACTNRYIEKNFDTISQQAKVNRQSRTPEQKEEMREYQRAYRAKYRETHGRNRPFKLSDAAASKNADRNLTKIAYHRAARKGALPNQTKQEIMAQTLPFYKKKREMEQSTGIRYDVDHIVPIFAGGLHAAENLQVILHEFHKEKSRGDLVRYAHLYKGRGRGKAACT